jgi:hypothetical protein
MALKPWEGNGGTLYIKNISELPKNMNLSGSAAEKKVISQAQQGVATDIFQKSFFDRGKNYGFASASEMATAYINPTESVMTKKIETLTSEQGGFSTAGSSGGLARFPDETSSENPLSNKWLWIAGAVILGAILLKKK